MRTTGPCGDSSVLKLLYVPAARSASSSAPISLREPAHRCPHARPPSAAAAAVPVRSGPRRSASRRAAPAGRRSGWSTILHASPASSSANARSNSREIELLRDERAQVDDAVLEQPARLVPGREDLAPADGGDGEVLEDERLGDVELDRLRGNPEQDHAAAVADDAEGIADRLRRRPTSRRRRPGALPRSARRTRQRRRRRRGRRARRARPSAPRARAGTACGRTRARGRRRTRGRCRC